jgi:hypothetical protein|tara:strand:- start:341 stop:511 length:171 start_codon:yes stop_codon:yes gene_type:complete
MRTMVAVDLRVVQAKEGLVADLRAVKNKSACESLKKRYQFHRLRRSRNNDVKKFDR